MMQLNNVMKIMLFNISLQFFLSVLILSEFSSYCRRDKEQKKLILRTIKLKCQIYPSSGTHLTKNFSRIQILTKLWLLITYYQASKVTVLKNFFLDFDLFCRHSGLKHEPTLKSASFISLARVDEM